MNNTNQTPCTMSEKDIMSDVLASQKNATTLYNTFANECACPSLRSTFLNILDEEHQLQYDVFQVMQKKNWYPTPQADQSKIDQTKQQFQQS